MPYGLTKEVWSGIENGTVREIYMTPASTRAVLLAGYSTEELLGAVKDMRPLKKSAQKIIMITKELERREGKERNAPLLTGKEYECFAREWRIMQTLFKIATKHRKSGCWIPGTDEYDSISTEWRIMQLLFRAAQGRG